ncbi:hypothetical protein C2I18_14450 [Paenibacillus sp. PK3_47]|uniref:hypothetical protein n=1 Tax=Paenibacillus sp. PK3_47 TaxID=2072642 RepID=UPI00201D3C64|nr:hypothetical protein [Paenibacillus sp. PK3_47]UQZ34619.1 hypothetical protein C2I18_14450 [Paenibacillus sp. PK3_47]
MSATKINDGKVAVELLLPFLIYKFIIGSDPSTGEYNMRLLWQKVGYLAKQVGMPLSEYQFKWYLRGPYSSAYTSVLYDIDQNTNELHEQEKQFNLNDTAQAVLLPLKEMGNNKPSDMSLPIWFELLASIQYLNKGSKLTPDELFIKLERYKPQFNNKYHFDLAYQQLKIGKLL